MWPFKKKCEHEFDFSNDVKFTNIPIPEGKGYYPGSSKMIKHPAHTHRLYCQCHKCDEWFFVHYASQVPGKLVRLTKSK